ncbi:MAG: type II secretion system protein [Kiritimatiellia bacterium]
MRKGFTLLETVIATSLTAMIMVAAVGSWILFLHKSNKANQQAFLDMDARRVVEQFRHEVRNAARETIMFYPDNQEPYLALGFALARDTDNDGLMDMDAQGSNILWRETVVYHVWNNSKPPEMRRTVFYSRNNDASRSTYYNQLKTVAETGSGDAACLTGESSDTQTMFSNLFTGNLWHAEASFDGYDANENTREKVTFGTVSLKPGAHQLKLEITGKNPFSSGRTLRIDQLGLGVCGWLHEAESCELAGTAATSLFVGPNNAGAAYSVYAPTSSDGDTLLVTLYNDAIEEAEFIGSGRNISLSNTVVILEG